LICLSTGYKLPSRQSAEEERVSRDENIPALEAAKRHLLRLFIQEALTLPAEHRELQRGKPLVSFATRGRDVLYHYEENS